MLEAGVFNSCEKEVVMKAVSGVADAGEEAAGMKRNEQRKAG